MITKNFSTSAGRQVEVTGELVKKNGTVKIVLDVVVEGFGSQGGSVARGSFTHGGTDYEGVVGKLPLTQEHMELIDGMMRELMIARDARPQYQNEYEGTYDSVEALHPWMSGTY